MGTLPRQLAAVPGLRFAKLLGSGYDFGLKPNFARYGLMAVWDDDATARRFFERNPHWQAYQERSHELWTADLLPLQGHGLWDGSNPFDYAPRADAPAEAPVAVLTRASIRLLRSWKFWQAVPPVSRAVQQAPGLLAAIGLGELPIVRQATFSLWRSAAEMRQYAYGQQHEGRHKEIIKRTRQEGWYSEEMFARFRVLSTRGTWDGQNPLPLP
ncbi:spheroidene monooxygenase [Hymenobacter oligotrophus]|uniref:Spheroidene monooxygenase n=2 Tax=Hymenobacter oligotrophus TaxID=2319843 RepID=A0A3B7RDV2_9BACT|nr:spheroidene monooxygenase [Hymenobacter oligotrophus]